jgi:hypothetical protein
MLNDIILRDYLNVSNYIYAHISDLNYYKRNKYVYFLSNSYTIVVGYIIPTLNNKEIEYPVIGMSEVRLRKRLIKEIKKKVYKRKVLIEINKIYEKYNLPIEIEIIINEIIFTPLEFNAKDNYIIL